MQSVLNDKKFMQIKRHNQEEMNMERRPVSLCVKTVFFFGFNSITSSIYIYNYFYIDFESAGVYSAIRSNKFKE